MTNILQYTTPPCVSLCRWRGSINQSGRAAMLALACRWVSKTRYIPTKWIVYSSLMHHLGRLILLFFSLVLCILLNAACVLPSSSFFFYTWSMGTLMWMKNGGHLGIDSEQHDIRQRTLSGLRQYAEFHRIYNLARKKKKNVIPENRTQDPIFFGASRQMSLIVHRR